MKTKILHAGAAAALVWAGSARGDDAQQSQVRDPQHDAVHAAMHEAMQTQMTMPPPTAQMPGMADRAGAEAAAAARQRAAQMQQVRDAARERAMAHGAHDAAMARGDKPTRGGTQNGTMHDGAGMMGNGSTAQQGAGMMRTGDMHGGSGGMMSGSGTGAGAGPGGGMMGGTTSGTGTTTGATPGTTATGTSGGVMMVK